MSARLARAACSPAEKTILSNGGSDEDAGAALRRKWLVPSLSKIWTEKRNSCGAEFGRYIHLFLKEEYENKSKN